MKSFKILLIAVVSITTINVRAQQRTKMDPQQMTDNIKQHVTAVTSDQEAKILAIEQDFTKALQDARASSNGDRDTMHAKMKTLREDRDAKIKGVLTADQYAQYIQMEKSHQSGGGKRGK